MSNQDLPQHSGSRWEPPAGHHPGGAPTPAVDPTGPATATGAAGEEKSRRRRGPLLAVLATVLTLGASTAGIAYVQAAQSTDAHEPAATTGEVPSAGAPGTDRAGERDGDGDRAGDRDGDGDRRWSGPRGDGSHDDDGDHGDRTGSRDGDDSADAGSDDGES